MKICHITSVHIPFDTRIFYKECKSLARAGYDVHLVAPHAKDEVIEGITIHAVPVRKSKVRRMMFTIGDVYRKALACQSEIYHFHDPELIPVGLLLKLHGKKVIADVHEDYPVYIHYKHEIPWPVRGLAALLTERFERYSSRFFDAVITVTPKINERFKRFNKNTVSIHNFPILGELSSGNDLKPFESRQDAVTFIGNITLCRGIEEMVQAIELIQTRKPAGLILGGSFPTESLRKRIERMPGFEFVDYRGYLSRKEVSEVFSESKAGLVVTRPNSNHKFAYMTKLFEYMAAGIPVIASDFPLWREIVDGAYCGLLIEPENPEAMAKAILYILEHPKEAAEMGKNGKSAVEKTYNWNNEERRLIELYRSLLQ